MRRLWVKWGLLAMLFDYALPREKGLLPGIQSKGVPERSPFINQQTWRWQFIWLLYSSEQSQQADALRSGYNHSLLSCFLQLETMERREGMIQIIALGIKAFISASFHRKTIPAIVMEARNALILGRINVCQILLIPSRCQRYCVSSAMIWWMPSTWKHSFW